MTTDDLFFFIWVGGAVFLWVVLLCIYWTERTNPKTLLTYGGLVTAAFTAIFPFLSVVVAAMMISFFPAAFGILLSWTEKSVYRSRP